MPNESVLNEVRFVPIDEIEIFWANPNVVEKEELDALKEDMKKGQEAISPIIIVEKFPVEAFPGAKDAKKRYVCEDGNHRLKIARELKWKDIPAIVDSTIHSEADLRSSNYRKNKERGQTDAFKEAELFAWYVEQGKTQQQIADEFNVDRTYVTKRLSLKKLSKATLGITETVKGMEASHYEVIAPLPEQLQEKAAREIVQDSRFSGTVRVSQVVDIVKRIKESQERAEKFQKTMLKEDAKVKECPKCKRAAVELAYQGYPWVRCENYHNWDARTGKAEWYDSSSGSTHKATKKALSLPHFIRTEHSLEAFESPMVEALLDAHERTVKVNEFRLAGKAKDGGDIDILFSRRPDALVLDFKCGRLKKFGLHVEKKEYKQEDLKSVKSIVSIGVFDTPSKKKLEDLEEQVKDLFSKYGVESKPSDVNDEGLTQEDRGSLTKLEERLEAGRNMSQLAALKKLKELAKI